MGGFLEHKINIKKIYYLQNNEYLVFLSTIILIQYCFYLFFDGFVELLNIISSLNLFNIQ